MNFIRYDVKTGRIVSTGFMDDVHVQAEIDAGLPTLFAANIYDLEAWSVNLETKQIQNVPPPPIPVPTPDPPPPPSQQPSPVVTQAP